MRLHWFRRSRRRAEVADDVRAELAFHRELRARELMAGGLDPRAAEEQAARALGAADFERGLVRLAESRDRRLRLWTLLDELRSDTADALRRLRRSPGFAAGAIAVVALGLGANSAVFAVANTVYLRPLPFAEASRLIRVNERQRGASGAAQWYDTSSVTLEAAQHNPAMAVVSALRPVGAHLLGRDGAEHVAVGAVTAGWGDVLGVTPVIGRLFSPDEYAAGAHAGVAVISYRLWQSHFGGRPEALGASLQFDDGARSVIGVLPPGLNFPYEEDAWWPLQIHPAERGFFMWARLRPGATVAQANASFDAVAPTLLREHADIMRGLWPAARPLREVLIGDQDRVVLVLAWAVAILLLIAGSNVAMLLITRFTARQTELAVRAALGCGRARQVRLLALEATLVFLAGGVLGLGLARLANGSMQALIPTTLAQQTAMSTVPVDGRVAAFALILALGTGVLFGLIASTRVSHLEIASVLRRSLRGDAGADSRRMLGALVSIELALAAALVTAALTLGAEFRHLQTHDVGFPTDGLLTFHFDLETARLMKPGVRTDLASRLTARLSRLPGVSGVGISTINPLCCGDWGARIDVEGHPLPLDQAPMISHALAFPGFFATLGIRVLAGRVFTDEDRLGSEPVVVIDDRLARQYFPAGGAVGRRIRRATPDGAAPWMRVIGVVEDPGYYGAAWYQPYLQYPSGPSSNELHVWLRAPALDRITPMVRAAVAEVDPTIPIVDLRSTDEIRATSLDPQRLGTVVAALFAAAGALLALLGVYGLVSFVVAREEREMGIRLALGATPGAVCRRVIGRMLALGAFGTAAGVVVARIAHAPLVAALQSAATTMRPDAVWGQAMLVALALLAAVALAAWLPARRVLRLDPARVLGR